MKCSRFRITQWDCLLTLGKIISIQFFAYFLLGLVMLLISLAIGNNFSLSLLFQYHVVQGTVLGGTAITSVFIINSVLCAILLWAVVKRAKQCLDFSCTFHGFHLLVCWWYNSTFPTNLSWWLLNAITSAIMCIGGEFLCLKSELNKIPIGYTALNEKSDV